jgi:hypothetical protein
VNKVELAETGLRSPILIQALTWVSACRRRQGSQDLTSAQVHQSQPGGGLGRVTITPPRSVAMRVPVIAGRRVAPYFGVRGNLLSNAVGGLDGQHPIDAVAEFQGTHEASRPHA